VVSASYPLLWSILVTWGFTGLAFVRFAYDSLEAERLAALSVSSINTLGFIIALIVLETFVNDKSRTYLLREILSRLSKNPLKLSIILGVSLSLLSVEIPSPLSSGLQMISSSVAPVAIFMLGISINGKEYDNLLEAALIGSLRLLVLPSVAFIVSRYFGLSVLETSVMVVMYGSPLALSMMILSQRYGFEERRIASIFLGSSFFAGLTMNLWVLAVEAFL